MPRLFTGLALPPETTDRLALLRGGLPGARWIEPDDYHVTLRFVGDVDLPTARAIAEGLERVARAPFAISIEGLDAFGSRQPHAIVARVAASDPLRELQADHERLMQRLGLPADSRRFTPHVTLARLRGVPVRDAVAYLSLRGGFATEPFMVGEFLLFSSRDSVGGGPYVAEAAYRLAVRAGAR